MRTPWVVTLVGGGFWVGLVLALQPGWAEAFLLLGSLVIVPLGCCNAQDSAYIRAAWRLQPVAALLLAVSYTRPVGAVAAGLTLPWVGVTVLAAVAGFDRIRRGVRGTAELSETAGWVFLAIGGAWTFASRLGMRPMGFPDIIVLMTAVHFHYAGFALPILAGRVVADLPGPITRMAAWGVVSGVPLVALGITDSQLGWNVFTFHGLELASVVMTALSASVVGVAEIGIAFDRRKSGVVRGLLGASGIAVLLPMGFAVAYALGGLRQVAWVDLPQMFRFHGAVNALGFAWPGLLAQALDDTGRQSSVSTP